MIHSSNFPLIFVSQPTVLEILNIFTLPPYLNDQIPPIFGDFLRKNPMPKIDKIQINQINEKLKNNYSITMSLSPIEKDFTYNQSMIIFYIRNFSTFSKYQNSAILCLMYSVISFLSTKDLSTVSSSFPNLLDSIILSKSILPKSYYIFSLSSCIVHYIEDNSFPFTPALVIRSFPTVNKDFYDLFTFVLAHALKKCEEESITHLVKTFTDAVNNNPNEFIECDFTNILSYLSQKIMGFDQLVLELIDSLSYVKNDDENIKDCMKTIPIYFSYHTPSTFKICEKPIKPYDKPKFFRFSYEFETESYFSNGLIPLPSEFFDKDYPINFNIDNVLKSIVPFLKKLSPGYFNYFFEMFPVSDDTKYLFFINLLCELSNKIVISSNILMKMLNPIVFSPHITLFNYKEEYNTIFAFRKKIFSMILAEHQNVMPLFLSHFDSTPLLFAEFIGRLHCNLSLLDASLLTDEATMNSIVQVMMFLKEEKSEIYQKARSTFYLFLFSILRDENSAREMFFASSIFVGGYFTSILEPTLHSSILNSYLSFLQQCTNPEILRPSIDMMCSVINFCDDVEIAYSVLNMFIKTLSINQKIASKVTPFVDCITAYLHTHPSQKFLNETIQLYLHCEYQFEMRQIRELSNSIHKINGNNDPDDGLISNMLCLISNIPSASINSRFSIQNETLLIAFFSIFKSAEKAKPIFDLFSDLCHFSSYNCYQCSRAEIDLLFIEMVRNYPNKFHFRGCKMNSCIIESKEKIIDLLCFIACVYCSPPVCLQIISLFQTFDTNLLNKMLANLVNIRKNIQPIGLSNNQVFMSKYAIKGKEIDKKFSFQFWVKVDAAICHYSDCIINIFKIVDGSLKMSLMINNNGSLIVRMESDYGASSAMLKQHFPSSKNWNLVSIVFKRKEGVSSVLSCSINSGKFDNFTVDFPHFSNNYIEIYVGTVESIKPIKSIFPIFLGEFWFYTRKLNPEEVVNYYQKGGISNDFIFQNSPISKYVFPNFLDVFMTTKIHQFILPFFYLSEGEMKSMFLETLIDILKAGISYIKKVDIDFKIYAFALKKSPFITFSLYQRFFSILDCSLNQATFKSLVYDILLNFGIWCNTNDPSHLHRIVQHWGISLFNACSLVLNNFSIVFSQIALYFPFNKKLNIDIDVHLCRSYIDKLLLSMATVNFTEENALAIISQCAQSNDSIQTLYDFDLLYKICLSKKDLPTSLCKILFYFLKPKKEKQFIAVLKIIYVIANEKFTKYVDLILCIFNNFYITKELFDGLLEILPDFPLIYPIIIFLALNLDYNELDRVSNALKSLKISSLATNWLLMPLLLFAVTRSVDVVIFCSSNMIDNFTYDAFEYTLSFIDFLSEILDINFEDFTLKFTKIVVDFLNNDNIIELQKIFAICARLLLLNTKQSSSFDYVDETAPIKFEFRSSIDSYIKILDKDISESRLYFRISQSPLLTTAIRLFPKIKTEIPLMKVMCHFFVNISNKTRMTFPFLTSLNSMFPFFYENASENFMKKLLMFQNKQIEYWNRAKEYSIKYFTSFGSKEASIAVSNIDFLKNDNDDKKIETDLRKTVFSKFSIWSHKKLYLTEIRRVFQYSGLLNQIRLKQSANSKKVSNTSQPKLKPETFFSAKCMVIKITGETPAEFSLCTDRFLLTTAYSQKVVMLSEIRHILRRNRFQIPNSLEFILVNGRSLLLDFTPLGSKAILRNFRNLRCENLKSFQILSPKEYFEKSGLTEKWKTRQISNFEYLMALNIYGGRSFNDSNLYPIFPWIVTKFFGFESNSLSFSQSIEFDAKKEPIDIKSEVRRSSSFTLYSRNEQRNLNLPIAIQTPEKYDELKVKFSNDEPINHTNCFFLVAPSNTAMVAHWLIRQPPFTQLHWKTEDGRFGFSARLFQSINRAAYQALRGSISWELCPEFFCFPEVFVNMNGYKMGENVDDVFPLETAIDFVYFHRKFLESEEVSMNLNGWIDLIFGKKIYSIDTGNVYSPILSEDAWASQISKDYPKGFIVETLKTSGQLPQNMFSELHPKRNPFTTMKMNITCKVNSELHSINHVKYLKKLDDEMVFLISNDNGSICTALVNFDAKVCRSEFPVYQNGDINRVKGDLFVNFLNGFCVFDQINSEFYIVKNSTLEQISCAEDVDFAYGSNDAICIGNNKGVFEYFLLNDMSIDPIRFNFLYDRVSCFTFSLSFGVIIYGSVTGFIYISDIKTGQISFHSSLEGKCPKKIFVTDGFGFIVVYCDDFSVFLFNINGFFIRKVKFVTPMRNMSVFKSNNGFDYMVVVDMKGAIKLCEVFYLDFGDVLFNCRAEIVALDYDSSADAILAVSKNGSFFRIQAKTCQTLSG